MYKFPFPKFQEWKRAISVNPPDDPANASTPTFRKTATDSDSIANRSMTGNPTNTGNELDTIDGVVLKLDSSSGFRTPTSYDGGDPLRSRSVTADSVDAVFATGNHSVNAGSPLIPLVGVSSGGSRTPSERELTVCEETSLVS